MVRALPEVRVSTYLKRAHAHGPRCLVHSRHHGSALGPSTRKSTTTQLTCLRAAILSSLALLLCWARPPSPRLETVLRAFTRLLPCCSWCPEEGAVNLGGLAALGALVVAGCRRCWAGSGCFAVEDGTAHILGGGSHRVSLVRVL